MSEEDDERVRNLVSYKMYATDEEMEQAGPFILIIIVLIVIGVIVFNVFT